MIELSYFVILANDLETDGIWMYTSKADEVTFFGSKAFSCGNDSMGYGPGGGHALGISFESPLKFNGRWCDIIITSSRHYICKAEL